MLLGTYFFSFLAFALQREFGAKDFPRAHALYPCVLAAILAVEGQVGGENSLRVKASATHPFFFLFFFFWCFFFFCNSFLLASERAGIAFVPICGRNFYTENEIKEKKGWNKMDGNRKKNQETQGTCSEVGV